jgi:hypothetical protein
MEIFECSISSLVYKELTATRAELAKERETVKRLCIELAVSERTRLAALERLQVIERRLI